MPSICSSPNCKKCTADCLSTCEVCEEGYHLDADGRCRPCLAKGCISCNTDPGTCDACQANHGFDSAGDCVQCSSSTDCLTCSDNVSRCDSCPDGFSLQYFTGVCEPCMSRNCKTCNKDLAKCDSCFPGFEGDESTGHCWATAPVPLQGRCEGMTGPFSFVTTGTCGKHVHWFGCDTVGDSEMDCYNAVMAEPRCTKDYFTFNARGDKNCGCKTSNEEELVVYPDCLVDCHKITEINITMPDTDGTWNTTTTTTCANATNGLLLENTAEVEEAWRCVDVEGWVDADFATCADYTESCEGGLAKKAKHFYSQFASGGHSARTACCICGGGVWESAKPVEPQQPSNWFSWAR